MSLAFRSLLCDCRKFVRPVQPENLTRGLRTGMACFALAFLIVGTCPLTAGAQLTIDNPNGVGSTVFSGMDGNNVVGGYVDSMMRDHGFLYNGQTFTPIDVPNALLTDPFAVSGNNIVGSYTDSMMRDHGFLYNGATFTTLDVAGSIGTQAHGISGNHIVGEYVDSSFNVLGFLYDGANFTTLNGPIGATQTVAYGIEGNNIVGTYADATGTDHGFLYDGATYTTFTDPNAGTGFDIGTYASAI